jgi:acetolactate synthase-1/2/3 large subunit
VNGAHALLATLEANGVTTCFANPGTSEMHFVAGLDDFPEMRGVLCLFEGVATGAADGYARVTKRPAATLLHLGPGLANGWANLHNARRARVPIVNIVGDHATYHAQYDAPLQSDIASLVSGLEGWQRRTTHADGVAQDTADAVRAAYGPPGRIATLILPADVSWTEVTNPPRDWPLGEREGLTTPDESRLSRAVELLRTKRTALFLGGSALSAREMELAQRVAAATSCRVIMETFPTIMDHGAGIVSPERLIYLAEFAAAQLKDVEALILIGARVPVSFFAYPDIPSVIAPEGCEVLDLAPPGTDTNAALALIADELHAPRVALPTGDAPSAPSGALTTATFAAAVGATSPEGLIIADESNTSGVHLYGALQLAPPHQWMTLTGGSIGMGLPLALGAAVGSAQRVLCVEADGSMMYTLQALWTMARENLDVTVVALSNRSYAILNYELRRVGAVSEGSTSQRMLDLDEPTLDLCKLAEAQGVPSVRVTTADELVEALRHSYSTPGPMFIEAMLPKGLN